jgi:prepilin-type N-terminal cleavage/methylation domain-containing protein
MRGFTIVELMIVIAIIGIAAAIAFPVLFPETARDGHNVTTSVSSDPPGGWNSCTYIALTTDNRSAYLCGDRIYVK